MECPKAGLFDLDDTLAESFQAPSTDMINRLRSLIDVMPVGILTAASFQRMKEQFLGQLTNSPHISRLYVFSNVCSECFSWLEGWQREYAVSFTAKQHETIKKAVEESVSEIRLQPDPRHKPMYLKRDGKVAYAAIGIEASKEEKANWDPDRKKRIALKNAIQKRIDFAEVSVGGTTTVDITPKGIDKAYGVRWLSKRLGIEPRDMLYVGDALFESGNDAVVVSTEIQTRAVSGPAETLNVLDEILASCIS